MRALPEWIRTIWIEMIGDWSSAFLRCIWSIVVTSLPAFNSTAECFHKCLQYHTLYKICWPNGDFSWTGNKWLCLSNQSKTNFLCLWQVFCSGYTTFAGGSLINLTSYTISLMFVLKALAANLLNHRQDFSDGWQGFCMRFIRGLNCDCASLVAWWALRALPRSKKLFAWHWMGFANLSLSVNASTGIS